MSLIELAFPLGSDSADLLNRVRLISLGFWFSVLRSSVVPFKWDVLVSLTILMVDEPFLKVERSADLSVDPEELPDFLRENPRLDQLLSKPANIESLLRVLASLGDTMSFGWVPPAVPRANPSRPPTPARDCSNSSIRLSILYRAINLTIFQMHVNITKSATNTRNMKNNTFIVLSSTWSCVSCMLEGGLQEPSTKGRTAPQTQEKVSGEQSFLNNGSHQCAITNSTPTDLIVPSYKGPPCENDS